MRVITVLIHFLPLITFAQVDREAIRKKIQANIKEAQSCYTNALPQNPGLAGKVVVDFTIDDAGAVSKAIINDSKSSLSNSDVHKCLVQKFLAWKFDPAPKGATITVSYPFHFSN